MLYRTRSVLGLLSGKTFETLFILSIYKQTCKLSGGTVHKEFLIGAVLVQVHRHGPGKRHARDSRHQGLQRGTDETRRDRHGHANHVGCVKIYKKELVANFKGLLTLTLKIFFHTKLV